jgi:murein DD-endopeptidase MepM/ murein hydrolase activator NlpD
MLRTIATALLCWLLLLAQSHGQDVFVPRQLRAIAVTPSEKEHAPQTEKAPPAKGSVVAKQPVMRQSAKTAPADEPPANPRPEKVQSVKAEPVRVPAVKEPAANPHSEKVHSVKADPVKAPVVKEPVPNPHSEKVESAKAEPVKAPALKEPAANSHSEKVQSVKADVVKMPAAPKPMVNVQLSNTSMETASTRLADGFDFPVGKPEAEGYYKARGFRSGGHIDEDWDGIRGGDTDLNDPIYCIGDGIVVFARDVHRGWGNVVIVRHAYRENGTVKHIDSLYGHLNSILVNRGQKVARGQEIGTMGTAHGQYDAHLHLEIRKNLEIGMSRSKFQKNLSNYYDPSQFIVSHRHLSGGGANFRVAMNTFTHDSAYHFDDSPNFSARKHSTAQSAAALKQAISSTAH